MLAPDLPGTERHVGDGAAEADGAPGRPTAKTGRFRSWRLRLIVAACVLAAIYGSRGLLLTACVWPLQTSHSEAEFNHVVVIGGDRCFLRAAQMGRDRRLRYLIATWQPGRLVRRGLIPSRSDIAWRHLIKHGVDETDITTLPATANSTDHLMRILGQQLADNRNMRIAVLCDAFHTRRLQTIVDRNLAADHANRIAIVGLKNRHYAPNNWWQSKLGLLAVFHSYIDLYFAVAPANNAQWKESDPTDISRSVVR